MATSVEDGSLERFRNEAQAIRARADWQVFALLAGAALLVDLLFFLAIALRAPSSAFLWPMVAASVLTLATVGWTLRTRRSEAGVTMLATMMVLGCSPIILIQRGANAPALIYGLATVAAVFVAGRERLGGGLALWLTLWTGAVTWAAASGRFAIDAANPLGPDRARLVAFVVAVVLIALVSIVMRRRRRALDLLLERSLRLTETERDEAQRQAERRARMVAEIGHEIRTPMTGIVGAAQLISQHPLSPVQRQLLSIQRQSAERLLQLVNAVLDEATLEAGARRAEQAPFSPALLVSEVTDLFAPQAQRKGIEIIWTAEPRSPRVVLGDAMRVRQVLYNLVSNAVKFTDQGSIHIRLAPVDSARMRIEVEDTGRGIAAGRTEAIFERFVSDAPGHERALSTGLGLPICRELAQLLGGQLTLRSRPGSGSCFTLELPCPAAPPGAGTELPLPPVPGGRLWVLGASHALETQLRYLLGEMGVDLRFVDALPSPAEWAQDGPSAQALLIDIWVGHGRCAEQFPALREAARRQGWRVLVIGSVAQDAALGVLDDVWQVYRPPSRSALQEAFEWAFGGGPRAAAPSASAVTPLRVLLADDNPVNQFVGKAMLDQLGADAVVVHDGQAAVEQALQQTFDLVLMDLQMPVLDGLEATRRLRAHEQMHARRRTPVVAVTGQVSHDFDAERRAAGIDAVLNKPYTIDELRQLLRTHAGKATA